MAADYVRHDDGGADRAQREAGKERMELREREQGRRRRSRLGDCSGTGADKLPLNDARERGPRESSGNGSPLRRLSGRAAESKKRCPIDLAEVRGSPLGVHQDYRR
jgi:hypothetical protein